MTLYRPIKTVTPFATLFLLALFFVSPGFSQEKYSVLYQLIDKDSINLSRDLRLSTSFASATDAKKYIGDLPGLLLRAGYPVASIDSAKYDTSKARIVLFTGPKYRWHKIATDSVEPAVLEKIGWTKVPADLSLQAITQAQKKIISYYENNGYPFARVSLQDVSIFENELSGQLTVDKGRLYAIDSIVIYGNVKIRNGFLQKYLRIPNGSHYNKQTLDDINKRIRELPYLQQANNWNLTMLGTGATLNLYLEPKKSSRVDVLVGFLPGNEITGKTQITADVNLDLKNALGAGENIVVNWQQLQPQSPQLKLGYSQPYILKSDFGIDFSFNLYKRDSSWLQLNALLGVSYVISGQAFFNVFYQADNNYLLSGGIDTNRILITKKLPEIMDVRSGNFGLGYHYSKTDYRYNPRKGFEADLEATAGIKKAGRNNEVLSLKDPSQPAFDFSSLYDSVKLKTYRLRITAIAAKYTSLGGNSVLKTAVNGGMLQSPQLFRNELFRIGGYRLLRGFAEESLYVSRYATGTVEYRYLLGTNSYFFGFSDFGVSKTKTSYINSSNSYLSGGIGLEFETKVGLLNISYAVGKRNDIKFDLRNSSKIHFGYINYF